LLRIQDLYYIKRLEVMVACLPGRWSALLSQTAACKEKEREEKTAHLTHAGHYPLANYIHRRGRVECFDGTVTVPLSPPYPADGVASKDVILDSLTPR
jgi:hypothetical protein